jgi:dipeptidyl-peptidase-4
MKFPYQNSTRKNPFWIIAPFLVLANFCPGIIYSQPDNMKSSTGVIDVPAETVKRLRDIYEGNLFSTKSFQGIWMPDGSGYLVLETQAGTDLQMLVHYELPGSGRTELISSAKLRPPDMSGSVRIRDFSVSPDGNHILTEAALQKNEVEELHYWMLERKSGKLRKVSGGINNTISPDGKSILFTYGGNLFIYDLESDLKIPLTTNVGSGSITHNRAIWSPDSKQIAYVQTDDSGVRLRSMLVPGDPSYPGVRTDKFARVGGTIPSLRIAVTDAKGTETRWISIPVPAEGYYLGQISWAGNSKELLVEKHSRFRDKREFFIADVTTGALTRMYEESDPAWVIDSFGKNTGLEWINNYSRFLVLSEKDGWRHAYSCSRDGKNKQLLTPGDYDVIDRLKTDDRNEWFYFNASPDNGIQKYLFRIRLDGSGKRERITPLNQPGIHEYNLSPDARWAFHTWSSDKTPPVTELIELPGHRVIQILEDNKELKEKIELLNVQEKEFLKLDIGNGVVMDAWMIKPKNFDPSSKYPVFVYVYGEPHGQTVMDAWGHAMADYHRVIADLGYIVVSIDNRGTPCPKGAAWRRAIAGSLGPLSTEEQAAGLKELGRLRPYIDLTRVGIWGWSGGGSNTLNALFRKPDAYQLGIAVAPKPQPHLYNAWFQEIYMKTPEVNPEGYKNSAPINFAEGLKGNLLIIHGTGETNTHIQITEGLVDRLIELGKQFDYMTYPNRDHGIREGKGTPLHMRIFMVRYLLNHLPAGPQ